MKQKIVWYLLGLFTPVTALVVIGVLKGVPLENKAELLLSKWGICENGNLLTIRVFDFNDTGITVGLARDAENGFVKEIGVTKDPEGQFVWGFVYLAKGSLDAPMCYYGSPDSGIVWRDLNADCDFDQKIDYRHQQMKINVDDKWIIGTGKYQVITDEGVFKFGVQSGKWQLVEPNVPDIE